MEIISTATTTTDGVTAPAPAPATQTTAPAGDWTTGLNDDLKGYVQSKGFQNPGMAVDSYRNLEKLMGVPPERLLKMPDKAEDPAWAGIYDKLGRPKEAKDYDLKSIKGVENEFTLAMQAKFHEAGLSKAQALKVATAWNEQQETANKNAQTAYDAQLNQESNTLKNKWGAAFEQNTNIAKKAATQFGFDSDTLDKLENSMGFLKTMELMHTLGSKIGEDAYVSPQGGGKGMGLLSPEAARAQINMKMNDTEFQRRIRDKDSVATSEWNRLNEMAYPPMV